MTDCESKKTIRGLRVEVRSGQGNVAVCQVDGSANQWHVVQLKNLWSYPLHVTCRAYINPVGRPARVFFKSRYFPPDPSVTQSAWRIDDDIAATGKLPDIDHVALVSQHIGEEEVSVEVSADWADPEIDASDTLNILVIAQ